MSLSESNTSNYKRIARNAAMLYFRMLFTIIVTLYTSRVVLQTLGVEDFGIYSVVAGFVAILGFLNNAMTSATQRFLSYELGKVEEKNVLAIFSMSMNIHILIAVFALIIGETLGLWFVQTHLTIPIDRMLAAEWVFHLALFSFVITVVTVPYKALIIAYEKMNVFASISIFDVILKLIAVSSLHLFNVDTLFLYALLSLFVVFIVLSAYFTYSKAYLNDSKYRFHWDPRLFKVLLSYTGWNLWGNIAFVLSGQGINVLLNIFFGPTVNAARAIAMEVSSGLNSFVSSLQVAVNPQIIKSYASDNMSFMYQLVSYSSKYNFLLLFFISMPVFLNTDDVLNFWLGVVPEYAAIFIKLIIINILIDCISAPLMTAAQATGKIKLYQSIVAGLLLLNLPFSYLLLKADYEPTAVMYVGISTAIIAFIFRLIILNKLIRLPVSSFLKNVIFRIVVVVVISIVSYYLTMEFIYIDSNFWLESILSSICIFVTILAFGIDKYEKEFLLKTLNKIFFKIN